MGDFTPEDIGQLRQRVTWQSQPTAVDEMLEPTGALITIGTYYARVEPIGGMELMNARQLKPTTSHAVIMRNVGPIKPTDQLLFEGTGRVFGIDNVFRIDERNAFLRLHCSELKSPA
jgi:head-tail adaptor